jgi:hypothetical protein
MTALLQQVRAGNAGHEDANERHFQPFHLLGMLWVTSSATDTQRRGGSMVAGELGFAEVAPGHRVARVRGKRAFERRRRSLCWRGVAAALVCGPREVTARWESESGSLSGSGGCWRREMTGGSCPSATASGGARTQAVVGLKVNWPAKGKGRRATGREDRGLPADFGTTGRVCHTCFSKENQVHNYMYGRIYFHTYSDI